MIPELPPNPRAELEAKVTALLLGELPAGEAAIVREQIAKDAELGRLEKRLAQTLSLLRETVATPIGATPAQPLPLKLSPERREKLLAHFKTITPKEFEAKPRQTFSLLYPLAAVASIAILAALFMPSLSRSKSTASKVAIMSNLRQLDVAKHMWAEDNQKSAADVPTMKDLEPYLGRSPAAIVPSVGAETYTIGPVGRPAMAQLKDKTITLSGRQPDIGLLAQVPAAATMAPAPSVPPVADNLAQNEPVPQSPAQSQSQIVLPQGAQQQIAQLDDESANRQRQVATAAPAQIAAANESAQTISPATAAEAEDKFENNNSNFKKGYGNAAPIAKDSIGGIGGGGGAGAIAGTSGSVPANNTGTYYIDRDSHQVFVTTDSATRAAAQDAEDDRKMALEAYRQLPHPDKAGAPSAAAIPPPAHLAERMVRKEEPKLPQEPQSVTTAPGSTPPIPSSVASPAPASGSVPTTNLYTLNAVGYINIPSNFDVIVLTPNETPAKPVGQPFSNSGYLESLSKSRDGSSGAGSIQTADRPVALRQQAAQNDAPLSQPARPAPVPQPEVLTRDSAFTTFSLNISDVAFKLAEASLENGVLPDAASMRSEEFINAFDYRDQEPAPGVPIGFAWERAGDPFAHNRDFLRFSIKTAAQGRQPGRPLNLVLLLDKSGSMERADRVEIIAQALRVLAGQLQPNDTLSVVVFARTARLFVDGAPGSQARDIAKKLRDLTPEGGTNLEEAMRLAYATALRHYLPHGENRVVLLTDGAANLGNVEPDALKQKVAANHKQGIALDCFGVGWDGYNDDLLEKLSRAGNGRYGFINTPEEAATEFAGKLAGALRVAAADVKVQVEFNPKRVTAFRQIGYAKDQLKKEEFRDNNVKAAQIGAAESGNALYTVEINPAGEGPLGTVHVRFRVPGTERYEEHEWTLPYNGSAVPLEKAGPAMRLIATAAAFSEWLAASPYAVDVTPDRLLVYLTGVPQVYGADARPKKLEWMIRQAKSISSK